MRPLPVDDAIATIRNLPGGDALIRELYLDDPQEAAARFAASGEWTAVVELVGPGPGKDVVDVGAGGGIASIAFSDAGCNVVAVEPDPSPAVGTGRLRAAMGDRGIAIVEAVGEVLPLRSSSVDIVYCRQVLHHSRNLGALMSECARVVRAGGVVLACREHVVTDEVDRARFLDEHPVHRIAGGENAFTLDEYRSAFAGAGLELVSHLGPWDSVINAFPTARTVDELADIERRLMARRFGAIGALVASTPGIRSALRRWATRRKPGELHSFLAVRRR